MNQEQYSDLNEIQYQALEYSGMPYYRKEQSNYGTYVTGGKTKQGHHLHYKVEYLCENKTLSNSRMLWCRNYDTGDFGSIE